MPSNIKKSIDKKSPSTGVQKSSSKAPHPAREIPTTMMRAVKVPDLLSSSDIVQLQRTIGNRETRRLLDTRRPIQAKLTVGPANDKFEQEADSVARQVVRQISAPAAKPAQRRSPEEDEELIQGKPLQPFDGPKARRQSGLEDEELVQGKRIQLQEEDEELIQGKTEPGPVQRQEEEEELMTSSEIRRLGPEGGDVDPGIEATIQQSRGSGQPLRNNVREPMENAFGANFESVRVHTGSESDSLNSSIRSRAFTTGNNIYFKNGEYNTESSRGQELIAHELTHVVQQRAAKSTRRSSMSSSTPDHNSQQQQSNTDSTHADGRNPGKEKQFSAQPADGLNRSSNAGDGVIQPKLGFEIEMLTLVDINGRPPPEKAPLGKVGKHLHLEVDQNSKVASPTPSPAAAGSYKLPTKSGKKAKIGAYDLPAGWQRIIYYRPDDSSDWTAYDSEADLPTPRPVTAEIEPAYSQDGVNWTYDHPLGPGMGMDRYASIVEIVTEAYPAETDAGKKDLIEAMTDAAQLAADVETATGNFKNRVRLDTVNNVDAESNSIFIGNDQASDKQTTDGSIQTTLGLDLAEMGSFVKSTMGFGSQGLFRLKHHSDELVNYRAVDRVPLEVPRAVANATAIINQIGHKYKGWLIWSKSSDLTNMRGLLFLICQYLRMGRYFYEADRPLDKNIVPLLSRTNLSTIFQNLPKSERTWFKQHKADVLKAIYKETDRQKSSTVFTNKDEKEVSGHNPITVEQFVSNIFTKDDDGLTSELGGFHKMGLEDIDPEGKRPLGQRHRKGPIFEMRNLVPKGIDLDTDRFPRTSWVKLGTYMANLINILNRRSVKEAKQDVQIRASSQTGNVVKVEKQKPW